MSAPKLRFVRTLAVAVSDDDAHDLLVRGLGAVSAHEDAYALGGSAILVLPPSEAGPRGFIPLFVTHDLQLACDHFAEEGLVVRDLPWAPGARAVLVGTPSGELWVCIATTDALYEGER